MAERPGNCAMCGAGLAAEAGNGRKGGRAAAYCSGACRQRAFRYRSRAAEQHSALPPRLDRFVGRAKELVDLRPMLRRSRLLTLVGPPGVGKTRLAYELGMQAQAGYRGGVFLVELALVADADVVPQAVAASLGVTERPGEPLVDTLIAAVSDRNLLLVLDNCEHVVGACGRLVEALLRRCARLSVLATGREALRLPGEVVRQVAGLTQPDADTAASVADLLDSEAVQLFLDRARATDPDFTLTAANGPHVATVCVRLDGLPLAIELAAHMVRMLPVAELVAHLDDRFSVLTRGLRTADRRHHSLRAAIEWSYDLLRPAERAAFRRLSVLAGGFGLAAAAAVCVGADLPGSAVFELLAELEAKSLIVRVSGCVDTARFRMLESIRLYGREQLKTCDEETSAFDRLINWLAGLAKPVLDTPNVPSGMFEWVREEHDNLSHALRWMVGGADERQLLLAGALAHARFHRGNVGNTRALLSSALDTTAPTAEYRGRVLIEAGWLAAWQGELDTAVRLAEEGLTYQRRRNLPHMVAWHLRGLKWLYENCGDVAAGAAAQDESLRIGRECGDELGTALNLQNLAFQALIDGDLDKAARLIEEALPTLRAAAHSRGLNSTLHTAGAFAWQLGDSAGAEAYFAECLDNTEELSGFFVPIEGFAVVAAGTGRPERALRLIAAAAALQGPDHDPPDPWLQAQIDAARTAARGALPAGRAAAAEAAGSRLSVAQAVEYARSDVWIEPDTDEREASPLSPREREVAEFLAQGLTNGQIGAELGLSVRTIDAHVRSIRAKLDLRSRTQIAGWVALHPTDPPG